MLVKNMVIKIETKFWFIVGSIYIIIRLVLGINLTLDQILVSLTVYIWGLYNTAPIILKKSLHMPYTGELLEPGVHSVYRLCLLVIYLPLALVGLFLPEVREFIGA